MIGTILDKYEVLQKVGEGGMATVYRGRHTTLDREVAIKVLHPHLSSSTRNRKRFAREARAIEHLRHPNILEIFDYSGTDCSECYIITEFVDGETLSALMHRVGRIPSEITAQIGIALCGALAYAHEASILHRDLKPDNVMIRHDGTVKLMDFGIARFLDESQVTMTGALVGSPAFMSPEQAKEAPLDLRSDLFSLGTLLYHLVTGHLPFSGSNPSLILKNIIEGNRPQVTELAPTMSARLGDVIEQLMQQDREDRHPTASAVATDLAACLQEVGLPDDPRFGLAAFVAAPDTVTTELEAWLEPALLAHGKAMLAAGDHLAALRLFNRLLSLDEDNTEVLELVQGLHSDPEPPRRARLPVMAVLCVLAVALTAVGWAWVRTDDAPHVVPPEPQVRALPATTAPSAAPAQVPAPAAAPDDGGRTVVAIPHPTADIVRPILRPRPKPTPPPAPVAPEFGFLELRSDPFPVDIYEGSAKIGDVRQRDPIRLEAGAHALVLRLAVTEDYPYEVTILPGQTWEATLTDILPKTVYVRTAASDFAGACVAEVNGMAVGSLAALDHRVPLKRPDRDNTVTLRCPGEEARSHRYAAGTADLGFLRAP